MRRRIDWNKHINKTTEGRMVTVCRDNKPTGRRGWMSASIR